MRRDIPSIPEILSGFYLDRVGDRTVGLLIGKWEWKRTLFRAVSSVKGGTIPAMSGVQSFPSRLGEYSQK